MMIAELTVTLAILLLALAFIFWSSFKTQESKEISLTLLKLEKLFQRREELLTNLKDLENDRALNKVEVADYDDLKARFLSDTAYIYKEIENLEKSDPFLKAVNLDIQNHRGEN